MDGLLLQEGFRPDGQVLSLDFAGSPLARSGTIIDQSGRGNSGTVYGRPAVSFDGVNDYLDVDTPFDALGGHRYAVMAGWFYFEGSSDRAIYHSRYSGGAFVRVHIRLLDDDTLVVSCATAKGDSLTSEITTNTLPQNQWVSLLILMDAEDNLSTVWVNGQLLETLAMTPAFSQDTFEADVPEDILWGIHPSIAYQYDGKMKNLGFGGFDAPPTLADAKRFHNFPQQWLGEFGFDAYYRCNEGAGGDIIDWSGNGHTMSRVGATWNTGANGGDTWVKGSDAINDSSWTDPVADTTFVVDNGSKFAANDIIRVSDSAELMQVTNVSTNTLTVTRGYLGTTAEALANDDVLLIQGDGYNPEGLFFEGLRTYVETTDSVNLTGSNWTMLTWVNNAKSASTTIKRILSWDNAAFDLAYQSSNGRVYVYAPSTGWVHLGNLPDGEGVMALVSVIYDGSDITMRVNGENPQTRSGVGALDVDGTMRIGARRSVVQAYFEGKLDDIQIYNEVLSTGEIIALYNQGK